MAQWEPLNYAQKNCVKSAGKLLQDTGALSPGTRVGVAVSGGVDSFVLIQSLIYRQRILPFPMELMVLHLNPGFDPENHVPLIPWVRENGLAAHIEPTDHGPRAHSDENQKRSACFYCARLRRKRLFDLCLEYKLTHLAFGHTAEDLVSTFFLNMFQAGRAESLRPAEPFFRGSLMVIRPLLWLEKDVIRRAAKAWALPVWENPCPSAAHSKRQWAMDKIKGIYSNDKRMRQNIFNAIKRRELDTK